MTDVLIIGAGASGLMAARELTKAGKNVVVLEARSRLGGRINTLTGNKFTLPVDTGAEFVHGDLPLTKSLLKETNATLHLLEGKNYQVKDGLVLESEEFIQNFDELLARLKSLEHDIPFATFIEKYLNDPEFAELRESIIRFAEGYDAADIHKASSLALLEEWQTEGAANSYLPVGGYHQLIDMLATQVSTAQGKIVLSEQVKEIKWHPSRVEVLCAGGARYTAFCILITVPLGVLQAEPNSESCITFNPEIPEKQSAIKALGFGAVIKVIFEFKEAFWEEGSQLIKATHKMPDLAFLFTSDSPISAWWTRLPNKTPVLSGWLAGQEAEKRRDASDQDILSEALNTLAYLFGTTVQDLQTVLVAWQVANWAADPFARGAYAYATVDGAAARQVLAQPEANTLFFAGEAMYEGAAIGTVEAALNSGKIAAQSILKVLENTKQ